MITISLEEKNAKIILNLLKGRMDDIDGQIKKLETDKKELMEIIDNLNPMIENPSIIENPTNNPIINNAQKEPEFILEEIEFDEESMPEITFGKNKLRRSEDGQKIYMRRNGYRAHVKTTLDGLIHLQEHPFEIEMAISNLSKNKQTVLARILKEIDFNKLDMIFQSCAPNQKDQTDRIEDGGQDEDQTEQENQTKNQNDQTKNQNDQTKNQNDHLDKK